MEKFTGGLVLSLMKDEFVKILVQDVVIKIKLKESNKMVIDAPKHLPIMRVRENQMELQKK